MDASIVCQIVEAVDGSAKLRGNLQAPGANIITLLNAELSTPIPAAEVAGISAAFATLDWTLPLSDLEMVLDASLAIVGNTDWGTTINPALAQWGARLDLQLQPGVTFSAIDIWASSTFTAIKTAYPDYTRLFLLRSLSSPSNFSLIADWQTPTSAVNCQQIVMAQGLGSVAQITQNYGAFHLLSLFAGPPAPGAKSIDYCLLQEWQLVAGKSGVDFATNRFNRFSAESAADPTDYIGGLAGWYTAASTRFEIIEGYQNAASAVSLNANAAVTAFDGAVVGALATQVSSTAWTVKAYK